MEFDFKKAIACLLLVLFAVISFFPLANRASNPATHEKVIASIDKNASTVLKLAASTTAASAGISMIPDDTATPIAEKLADFTEYFMIVLSVLYVEKYALTIFGALTFKILIPVACLAFVIGILTGAKAVHSIGMKFVLFAIAVSLAVPTSIWVSDTINETYHANIETTIASAEEFSQDTFRFSEAGGDKGLVASILQDLSETVSSLVNKASTIVNHFVELLAVMIVTSCVVPLLVILFFIWCIKVLTGVQISTTAIHLNPLKKKVHM